MARKYPKPTAEMKLWDHISNLFLTLLGRGTYPAWCFGCGLEERAYANGALLQGWQTIY